MENTYSGSDVRKYILENGVMLWKVAEKLGTTDSNFSRKLRHSFTDEEYKKIVDAVKELSKKH